MTSSVSESLINISQWMVPITINFESSNSDQARCTWYSIMW